MSASVLLADASSDFRNLTSHLLVRRGLELLCVATAAETIEAASARTFDAILIDVDSAEINGFETVCEVRDRGVAAPAIALTAQPGSDLSARAIQAGFCALIGKPVQVQQLVDAIVRQTTHGASLESDFADDVELAPLLREFAKNLPKRVEELSTAIQNRDSDRALALARELKILSSSSGGFGYSTLSSAAADLESCLSDGPDWSIAEPKFSKLRTMANRVAAPR
jgi:CheY-like chemotaxis protein